MKVLKGSIAAAVVLSLFCGGAGMAADIQMDEVKEHSLSSKVPLKLYGFISAEAMWANAQLSSFGTNSNIAANGGASPYNRNIVAFNRVIDETETANNDAFISATVQNSRFGFALDPYKPGGQGLSVDARLEMDFWSITNMSISSVMPRIRRAYAGLGGERWKFLAGQEWDVFSPLNTTTLNIGNDMWRQGNIGFRRPQFRFTYNHPMSDKGSLEGAVSVNLPSNNMNFDDSGNTTCVPMEEARLGYLHKLSAGMFRAYLSGAFARHNNAVAGGSQVNNWAIAASVDAPVHKYFNPIGELHYGYSMGLLLSNSADDRRQRFISGWASIKSAWLKWLETNVGYGIDVLNSDQVLAGWVRKNSLAFANIKFQPVNAFIAGLEYNYLRTTYNGTGTSDASAIFTNIMFYF